MKEVLLTCDDDAQVLSRELQMLDWLVTASPSPSAMCVLASHRNLLSTSHAAIAFESLDTVSLEGIALESLVSTIKDRATKWATKITSFFSDAGKSIVGKVTTLFAKLKEKGHKAIDQVLAKKDALKKYAKAHPYQTVARAALAAIAVCGLIAFVGAKFPVKASDKAVSAFSGEVAGKITKIDWPLGKLVPKVTENGRKIAVTVVAVPVTLGAGALLRYGWNKTKALDMIEMGDKVAAAFASAWSALGNLMGRFAKNVGSTIIGTVGAAKIGYRIGANLDGGEKPGLIRKIAGVYGAAFMAAVTLASSVIYTLYHLVRVIIIGAGKLIDTVFGNISKSTDAITDL